jgi:hypothetical protein
MPNICIGLGNSCAIAHEIYKCGLRNASYPFDWMLTSVEFLIRTFETDSFDFTNVEKLHVIFPNSAGSTHIYSSDTIKNTLYCTAISIHDADNATSITFPNLIEEINEKYKRRFKRLYDVLNNPENNIYLIRMLAKKDSHHQINYTLDNNEGISHLHNILIDKFKAKIILYVIAYPGQLTLENTDTLKIINEHNLNELLESLK